MARRGQPKSKNRIWWWTYYRVDAEDRPLDGRINAQAKKFVAWPSTTAALGHCFFPTSFYPTGRHLPAKRTELPIWPELTD